MTDHVVVNASPMIALLGIKQEGLLEKLFDVVCIPATVIAEIEAGRETDANVERLSTLSWLQPVDTPEIPDTVQGWGLGRGESSVLAVAAHRPGHGAILDDLAARRCARSLGVPLLGTGKVLLLAKQRGLIDSLRPLLDRLTGHGFHLSERLVAQLLNAADEDR